MSVTERLQAMDQLWDSLDRYDDEIPSSNWHQDVLAERKERVQRGEAKFLTVVQLRSGLRSSEPMTVIILKDSAEDLDSGAHSMNRVRRELVIILSTRFFPEESFLRRGFHPNDV